MRMDSFVNKSLIKVKMTAEDLNAACVELVTRNGRPFTLMEDSGMRKILGPLEAALKMKSHIPDQKVSNMVSQRAKAFRKVLGQELKGRLLSLKVDGVSRLSRSVLGINVQIMANHKINIRTLGVIELHHAHTG